MKLMAVDSSFRDGGSLCPNDEQTRAASRREVFGLDGKRIKQKAQAKVV